VRRFVTDLCGNAEDEIPHVLDTASRTSQSPTHKLVANNTVTNTNTVRFSTERKEATLIADFSA